MIHVYTDASMGNSVLSCGYIITQTERGEESLIDAGYRIMNTDAVRTDIDWCSSRGEYRALITGARAALDYTNDVIMMYSDNDAVVEDVRGRKGRWEGYFRHALFSFLGRFRDWHITNVDRERNELAHEQARIGLKLGRDIMKRFNNA